MVIHSWIECRHVVPYVVVLSRYVGWVRYYHMLYERVLTLSTGIDGHALHRFQNEPIMGYIADVHNQKQSVINEKEQYILLARRSHT